MSARIVERLALVALVAAAAATRADAQGLATLAGRWRGTLVNLPVRAGAPQVTVELEHGGIPAADSTCVPWVTRYVERDTVRQVKAYRLCRGRGADDLVVDEGDGIRLGARVVGDVLVSAFRVQGVLLVTHLRVRGDTLEEEIVSLGDAPPPATPDAVTSLRVRGIQRLVLQRVR